MPDLFRELFERPSRLLGWGVVALVHFVAWQVLVHGLNWVQVMPVLNSVQVIMMKDEPRPETPPAALPHVEIPVSVQVFVPAPEVKVAQESVMLVSVTSVPPPITAADAAPATTPSQTYSSSPVVVSESEVDYLVRPEVTYPLASKRARERGLVLLSVIVNSQGLVEYVNVYRSSGYRRLDECASRAVRRMRVKPYMRNGIAMAIELRIPVEFS